MRLFNRKSQLSRIRSGLPGVGSNKALKAGLIAAGGLAGLTADAVWNINEGAELLAEARPRWPRAPRPPSR